MYGSSVIVTDVLCDSSCPGCNVTESVKPKSLPFVELMNYGYQEASHERRLLFCGTPCLQSNVTLLPPCLCTHFGIPFLKTLRGELLRGILFWK